MHLLRPLLLASWLTIGLVAADATTDDPFAGAQRLLMKTSAGDIVLEVWPQVAPETVANFVGLATGTKSWTAPGGGERNDSPFYDGLVFHRVIDDFMIQGGCPLGQGTGGPGYSFKDEISAQALGLDQEQTLVGQGLNQRCAYQQRDFMQQVVLPRMKAAGDHQGLPQAERDQLYRQVLAELKGNFTLQQFYEALGYQYNAELPSQPPVAGALCMANSGPNTNGSQFFINLTDTPHLAGKHTVFGRVVEGMDVVRTIGSASVGAGSKPVKDVTIHSIRPVAEE